jgi:hypothetical protein
MHLAEVLMLFCANKQQRTTVSCIYIPKLLEIQLLALARLCDFCECLVRDTVTSAVGAEILKFSEKTYRE